MIPLRALLMTSLGLAFLNTSAIAATEFFTATITHDQETTTGSFLTSTGGARPVSFGSATFVLDDARTSFIFSGTIHNIDITGVQTADSNDNLVAAHIHNAAAGMNGGVRWGFLGNPFNDNNPNDFALTPFASGVGGTFTGKWDLPEGNNTTLTAQVPNILADLTYINFHTVQFAAGEIRGQITRVPDSGSTFALLGCVLMGLLHARRKFSR
jgi:hypothetical protein